MPPKTLPEKMGCDCEQYLKYLETLTLIVRILKRQESLIMALRSLRKVVTKCII